MHSATPQARGTNLYAPTKWNVTFYSVLMLRIDYLANMDILDQFSFVYLNLFPLRMRYVANRFYRGLRQVDEMMLRTEVFMLFQNGADGRHKGNVRTLSKLLHTKYKTYNGKWKNFESCYRCVRILLKRIKTKTAEDPSLNPFRDGHTTFKRTRRVTDDPDAKYGVLWQIVWIRRLRQN